MRVVAQKSAIFFDRLFKTKSKIGTRDNITKKRRCHSVSPTFGLKFHYKIEVVLLLFYNCADCSTFVHFCQTRCGKKTSEIFKAKTTHTILVKLTPNQICVSMRLCFRNAFSDVL